MSGLTLFRCRLAADPDVKSGPNYKLTKLRIAQKSEVKGKAGAPSKQVSEFFDVTCWGKVAEGAARLVKGDVLLIEAKPKIEAWVDKTTQKNKSKVAFVAETVALVVWGDAQGQGSAALNQPGQHSEAPPPPPPPMDPPPMDPPADFPPDGDDLPF